MPLVYESEKFETNGIRIIRYHKDKINKNFLFDLKDKEVNVIIPEEILRADGLQIMKHFIQLDIFKFVPTLEKVSFVETHINKQTQEKKPETKEKAPEQKTA